MLKHILIVIVSFVAVVSVATIAYAEMNHSEHNSHAVVEQETSQQAVNAGNKVCPVSGELVGQGGMDPVTYEYQGKIYNFCCAMCIDEFKKDPEKYIKK